MDYNSKLRFCVYCHTSPSGKKYFGKTFGLTEDDANRNRWNDGKSYTHQFEDVSFEYPAFGPAILKYDWVMTDDEDRRRVPKCVLKVFPNLRVV